MSRIRGALALATASFALGFPAGAQGVIPTWPPEGTSTSSTPTFSWQRPSNEQVDWLELSTNPAPGADGGFTEDEDKRTEVLADAQSSFRVGSAQRLSAGVWYWHVHATRLPSYFSYWSAVRSIRVRDERIRLRKFTLTYFDCLKQFSVDVDYTDNSRTQRARWWLDFRKSRKGRRVARLRGRGGEGSIYASRRKPRKLRRGRYVARLYLRDGARHITRSRFRRVRVPDC